MCGIAGIIDLKNPLVAEKTLVKMSDAIVSRGPDDNGFFYGKGVGLAHRRLSIIDLDHGQQPMMSDDKRFIIVFNGEIYNFLDIKKDLQKQGISFHTNSDTEVLLKGYQYFGKDILQKLRGMFAFAIWDKIERKLFCARDRMGEKPFYYAFVNDQFIFASELKAIIQHPDIDKKIGKNAIKYFFTYEYIPAPYSIFENVLKLPQAHYLELDSEGKIQTQRYWNQPFEQKIEDDERVISRKLYDLLHESIQYQLIADVPLGVFLSGGLDSSSIVALMAEHRAGKDIQTFSINFSEESYNEGFFSSEVAKRFGTKHHTEVLSAQKMLEVLPQAISYMDEPFADTSILPTYLLSQFTKKHVKVALGGDGSDELFAGYPTFLADRFARIFQKSPKFLQKMAHIFARSLKSSDKNMSFDFKLRQFLAGASEPHVLRNQVWLSAVQNQQESDFYTQNFLQETNFIRPLDLIEQEMENCQSNILGDHLLYFYQKFYLCDNILVKTDRASMANSLEVRAPFLDHILVDYVSQIPYQLKLKGITSKYILKKAFNRKLPAMITQRKKKGFGSPITGWLKTDLKSVFLDYVNAQKIKSDGYFNWDYIQKMIEEHFAGKFNHRKPLFALLMFQMWKEEWCN